MPTTVTPDDIAAAPAAAAPPAEPAAPAAAAAETPAKDDGEGELPDKLLKEVPALQLLLHGSPPATIAPKTAEFPELKTVSAHLKDLGAAGFGIYQTKDKNSVVFFNGLFVTPDQVKAADEAGELDKLAVPYDQLRNALESGGGEAGAPGAASEAAGAPAAGVAAAGASAGAPASPAVEARLNAARITNLNPGTPTSGPAPGSGRLLNNILKPAI